VVPGGGAGGSRWLAMLFFFSLSLLCFSFSSLLPFFSFGLPPFFSLLFSALSLLFFLVLPFCSTPSVFIGKIGEGHAWGSHNATALPTHGNCGVMPASFLCFLEEESRGKLGEENLLLPLPRPSRGRRRHMVQFKMTLFLLYLKKKNV